MKKFLVISGLTLAAVVFLVVQATGGSPASDVEWPSGSITAVDSLVHDWEMINIQGGNVEHSFRLRNNSTEPLVIKTASTSCMCTTARIVIPGESNTQIFGMHNNPSKWNKIVPAGEEFEVKVIFDPLAHGPNEVGPIDRQAQVITSAAPDDTVTIADQSAASGSKLILRVFGRVLSETDYNDQMAMNSYPVKQGDFSFAEREYDFGTLKQSGGTVSHDFEFTYTGIEPVKVSGVPGSCACTTAEIDTAQLEKESQGVLTVTFDPNLHEEPEGKFYKTVSILTEPAQTIIPEIKIWAEIDLDLGPEAFKQQEHID